MPTPPTRPENHGVSRRENAGELKGAGEELIPS